MAAHHKNQHKSLLAIGKLLASHARAREAGGEIVRVLCDRHIGPCVRRSLSASFINAQGCGAESDGRWLHTNVDAVLRFGQALAEQYPEVPLLVHMCLADGGGVSTLVQQASRCMHIARCLTTLHTHEQQLSHAEACTGQQTWHADWVLERPVHHDFRPYAPCAKQHIRDSISVFQAAHVAQLHAIRQEVHATWQQQMRAGEDAWRVFISRVLQPVAARRASQRASPDAAQGLDFTALLRLHGPRQADAWGQQSHVCLDAVDLLLSQWNEAHEQKCVHPLTGVAADLQTALDHGHTMDTVALLAATAPSCHLSLVDVVPAV